MNPRPSDPYQPARAQMAATAAPLLAAQVYPQCFGPGRYEDVSGSLVDKRLGVDAAWHTDAGTIWLQEKTRGIEYAQRRDLLVRKVDPANKPGDLHKTAADYLIQTYLGPEGLGETIVLNLPVIKRRLALGTLPHSEFVSSQTGPNYILHIPDLLEAGIYAHHFLPEGGENAAAAA